ncbi:dentin matrix acidic phosphoprotein 1 [Juglans microcarpa x Juglans regia]|uniref:dentin matrix acidic phosphoprotein 1 n=1 Tax=Juglans microcarpa x Juglans regia TaxID=2249226 RepID=UPI001B7DB30E|nr:dentin matrix acidic phosphoprotein 1 [Juglans microcarpa x Juglans regia]
MASSESMDMDDSFRLRVEKVFGSLASSKPSALQSSIWSLTDDEVERREWRRGTDTSDRDDTPCAASFDDFAKEKRASRRKFRRGLEEDPDDLNDHEDDGDEKPDRSFRGGDEESEEWEIRSSIGLDPTLDNEEEEDEYDKVATGRENVGERLFMGDIAHHGSYLNSHNVLDTSLRGTSKDSRANHLAARIRLKEDEAEAEAQTYKSSDTNDSEVKEQHDEASKGCSQLRSILKRKENNTVSKSQKRVRFDPGCKDDSGEVLERSVHVLSTKATVSNDGILRAQNKSGVPDFLLNPSKYTRYSFDSTSSIDEESNAQACMEFFKLVNKLEPSKSGLETADSSADLPKSVTFIPKKKVIDAKVVSDSGVLKQNKEEDNEKSLHGGGFPVGIAAGDAQDEVSAMEEDESETNAADRSVSFVKPGRRYRTKSMSDDHDS